MVYFRQVWSQLRAAGMMFKRKKSSLFLKKNNYLDQVILHSRLEFANTTTSIVQELNVPTK